MSTQTSQYLIYGVRKPYNWTKEWETTNGTYEGGFCDHFEKFCDQSAFEKEPKHHDGIMCLRDGRDGRYCIIGRVLAKAPDGDMLGLDEPLQMPPSLTPLEREFIHRAIERHFGLTDLCAFWFVTHLS